MSHTDKTDPMWVRIATGYYSSEPVHFCVDRECDLPPLEDRRGVFKSRSCYWTFVYDGRNICSCWLCSGALDRRMERRRDRFESRRAGLRWRGEYNASGGIEEW